MDDEAWRAALDSLNQCTDRFAVLSRCLAVVPQLQEWQRTQDATAGTDAANALDQALGELERLAKGEAATLAAMVQTLLDDLPVPWE